MPSRRAWPSVAPTRSPLGRAVPAHRPHGCRAQLRSVIRVNSQSGKGGISYLLEQEHGIELPRRLSIEFSQVVQEVADRTGKEITSQMIYQAFADEYLEQRSPLALVNHRLSSEPDSPKVALEAIVENGGQRQTLTGEGNGPLAAFIKRWWRAAKRSKSLTIMNTPAAKGGCRSDRVRGSTHWWQSRVRRRYR